jgi:RNA polymerase primary sigma factor
MQIALHDKLDHMLDTQEFKKSKVLRLRFGLNESDEHTLEETGQVFLVKRKRIRQIEAKALRKLRYLSRAESLRSPAVSIQSKAYFHIATLNFG